MSLFDPTPNDPRLDWTCGRCKWRCKHVEMGGMWWCPNCGPARPVPGNPRYCTYEGNRGCKECSPVAEQADYETQVHAEVT